MSAILRHEASAPLASIINGQTIAEQQKYIAQLQRQIVELTNANAALAKQVEIERSFAINTAAWFVSDASDLVVYPDDKPVLAFTLLEEERGAVFGGVVRRFVMDEGTLPHRLCTVCRDLECGESIECRSRGSAVPRCRPIVDREGPCDPQGGEGSNVVSATAMTWLIAGGLLLIFIAGLDFMDDVRRARVSRVVLKQHMTALELLDECRAALSIEVEDAGCANFSDDFFAMCAKSSALSQQVDDFLESVGYSDMPRSGVRS